jgi:hypothetical protein
LWWIRAPWRIRCIPSALQSKVTPRRVGAAECDLMPPAGGRAVLCGRNFHDPEDLTVCTDCQVFAIMEAGCRRGTGSTPGCGMTGGQTTQMGARLSVARDTPRTRVILECSPRAPDPPPSPDPPLKSPARTPGTDGGRGSRDHSGQRDAGECHLDARERDPRHDHRRSGCVWVSW